MVNYYLIWDFALERFSEFRRVQHLLVGDKKVELPVEIDVVAMSRRGQMGRCWVSVIGG
ncbi:MAG: hypothetical protein AAGI23_11260 [Bacteroidota bacterium]